jgi:sporulation protein YlmC with PRC-barrel domain
MAQAVSFTIGAEVTCSDGPCGILKRVVLDPVAQTLTHLVVEPKHRLGLARLVPVDLAAATPDGVTLACTVAEFEQLNSAEDTQFVPGTRGYADYGPDQLLAWPWFSLQTSVAAQDITEMSQTVTYDTIPAGEVEVRRGEPVYATDGAIGHVQGLVIDPASHRVSHVLLAEGHLWGKKEVAIPVSAVTDVKEGIKLLITKQEVADLPPVGIDH